MEDDNESWPEDLPELKEIACLLKCGVCYDYLSAPVITQCSHTYCSLCIRKWLVNKQVCPSCSTDILESSLRKNLVLERIVVLFGDLVNKIVRQNCSTIPKTPSQARSSFCRKTSKVVLPLDVSPLSTISSKIDQHEEHKEFKPQHSSNMLRCSEAGPLQPSPKINNTGSKATSVQKVPCPVCSTPIPERTINDHLDRCLSGDLIKTRASSSSSALPQGGKAAVWMSPSSGTSPKTAVSEPSPKLVPLKKMVYNLMSDPQLKKELKKHGLPIQGDRRVLQSRIQRFVVLHNAECDSSHPRSLQEIKAQLALEEKALNTSSAPTSISKILKSGKTDPKTIETARKEYIQKNNSHYNKLIEEIRERNKPKLKETLSNKEENVIKTTPRDKNDTECIFLDSDVDDNDRQLTKKVVQNREKEAPSNETDSDDDFTFKKSHPMSSKRKYNSFRDDGDVTKESKCSTPEKRHPPGKRARKNKRNILNGPTASTDVYSESPTKEDSLLQGRSSPILTRRQSCRPEHSQIAPLMEVEDEVDEPKDKSSDSESLMSPTPDIFDDASVDSYITPGQKRNSLSESSEKICDGGTENLSALVSLLSNGSSTEFEED